MKLTATVVVSRSGFPDPAAMGRLMRPLASRVAKRVRDRTHAGRGASGRPFRKMADGRRADLRDTGDMVESFKPRKVWARGFELAPAAGRESHKALMHQVGIRRPRREWVGVSGTEVQKDVDAVVTEWLGRRRPAWER